MYSRRDWARLKKATNTVCRYCTDETKDCKSCIVMRTIDKIYHNSPWSKDSNTELKVYKLTVRFLDYTLIEECALIEEYDVAYYQAHDAEEAELLYEEECERSCNISSYTAKELTQEEINKISKSSINWYVAV